MRGLEKNRMKRDPHTRKHTDGHRDSMKESAKGRFFEKYYFFIVFSWIYVSLVLLGTRTMSWLEDRLLYLRSLVKQGGESFLGKAPYPANNTDPSTSLIDRKALLKILPSITSF